MLHAVQFIKSKW